MEIDESISSSLQTTNPDTVTLITLPYPMYQPSTDVQSLLNDNLMFNTLSDGSIVIDPNQLYNNNEIEIDPTGKFTLIANQNEDGSAKVSISYNDKNPPYTVTSSTFEQPTTNTAPNQKVRYLNSKLIKTPEIRKAGRPKKVVSKSKSNNKLGPFKCTHCDIEFDKYSSYKKHERSHIEEKKYKCENCTAAYNYRSNFLLHQAIHNTTNPTCPECGKTFHRLASLKSHLTIHEKEETFYCEECDMSFASETEIHEHTKKHGKSKKPIPEVLRCKLCAQVFNDKALLKIHMREHNRINNLLKVTVKKNQRRRSSVDCKIQCSDCPKRFQKRSQMVRHMRVHTGEKPFKCTECHRCFSQRGSLLTHMVRHTGNKPYLCTLCPATFSQKGNLRVHVKKTHSIPHDSPNSFACSECTCTFKRLGTLNGHMTRNHNKQQGNNDVSDVLSQLTAMQNNMNITANSDILQQAIIKSDLPVLQNTEVVPNEPPDFSDNTFVYLSDMGPNGTMHRYLIQQCMFGDVRWHMCSFCEKKFKKPSDLLRHIRTHTREKPYKCSLCPSSFAVKSTLTSHFRIHSRANRAQCNHCGKLYSSCYGLNNHMRQHWNQKLLKCTICNKGFRNNNVLKQHMKTHSLVEINNITAKQNDIPVVLQQPLRVTSEGLQSIPLQKRTVQEGGTKNRPYKCSFCNAVFRKLSHLKQHKLKHTGERPYRCNVCTRNFKSNSSLKTHLISHSGVKKFGCPKCRKNFASNGSLKRHMETHNPSKSYVCPYCYKDFRTMVNCRKHMKCHQVEVSAQAPIHKILYPKELGNELSTSPFSPIVEINEDIDDPSTALSTTTASIDLERDSVIIPPIADLEVPPPTELIPQSLPTQESGNILLPFIQNEQNLTATNIQELDESLKSQMLNIIGSNMDTTQYADVNKFNEPLTTTEDLINTLTGEPLKQIDNAYLYQNVIVNLNQDNEQVSVFDNTGIDNILSQVNLQTDPMSLSDLADNNIILPFQTTPETDFQLQNQMIMLPPNNIDQDQIVPIIMDPSINLDQLSYLLNPSDGTNLILANGTENLPLCSLPIDTMNENTNQIILNGQVPNMIDGSNECIQVCNVCKVTFKNHLELKAHECLNFVNVDLNTGTISETAETFNLTSDVLSEFVQPKLDVNKESTCVKKEPVQANSDKEKTTYKNQCKFCPKSFRKPSDLVRHNRTHTGERPFKCNECKKGFSLKSTLESHLSVHQMNRKHQCSVCGIHVSTKGSLTVHMRKHTGSKPYDCPLCPLKFRTTGHRTSHLDVHYREASKTGRLPKNVTTRTAKMTEFRDHVNNLLEMQDIKKENKENPAHSENSQVKTIENIVDSNNGELIQFEVETNEKGHVLNLKPASNMLLVDQIDQSVEFDETTKECIASFIREKTDKKMFDCQTCSKEFPTKPLLTRHQKTHTAQYVCEHCNKKYVQKSSLTLHLQTHLTKRPFACTLCPSSYTLCGNLKTHLRRVHNITDTQVPSPVSAFNSDETNYDVIN